MNSCEDPTDELSFWTKIKRRFVRFFISRGNCNESCDSCAKCPWLDEEKYSFEIKKRKEEN